MYNSLLQLLIVKHSVPTDKTGITDLNMPEVRTPPPSASQVRSRPASVPNIARSIAASDNLEDSPPSPIRTYSQRRTSPPTQIETVDHTRMSLSDHVSTGTGAPYASFASPQSGINHTRVHIVLIYFIVPSPQHQEFDQFIASQIQVKTEQLSAVEEHLAQQQQAMQKAIQVVLQLKSSLIAADDSRSRTSCATTQKSIRND